ncbi:MAG: flagellar export protein FliJ [Rhodoferax sp.]|nr:flagellar export protein FliJ [Rhodoferax sp.]
MPHLRAIALAIDLAARKRDEAVATLLKTRQSWHGAQEQMGQLQSYALETESHWALGAQTTANPQTVRHYDQFMDRLQQAVDMQQGVVGEQLQALEAARQRVVEAEIRAAGLKRLLEKRRAAHARVLAVREQKQLDELAALQFRRLHRHSETTGTS